MKIHMNQCPMNTTASTKQAVRIVIEMRYRRCRAPTSALWLRVAVVIRIASGSLRAMTSPYAAGRVHPRARPVTVSTPTIDGPATDLRRTMTDRTYRVTEIVGTSPEGIDQAIRNGISRAARTLRHVDWFEVTQVRGQVKDGAVEHYQVGLKLGSRLEDDCPRPPGRPPAAFSSLDGARSAFVRPP